MIWCHLQKQKKTCFLWKGPWMIGVWHNQAFFIQLFCSDRFWETHCWCSCISHIAWALQQHCVSNQLGPKTAFLLSMMLWCGLCGQWPNMHHNSKNEVIKLNQLNIVAHLERKTKGTEHHTQNKQFKSAMNNNMCDHVIKRRRVAVYCRFVVLEQWVTCRTCAKTQQDINLNRLEEEIRKQQCHFVMSVGWKTGSADIQVHCASKLSVLEKV